MIKALWVVNSWQSIAMALLTGADGHLLPVANLLVEAFATEFHFGALSK